MARAKQSLSTQEILERIHRLQDEIIERQHRIRALLETAAPSQALADLLLQDEEDRKARHLERLVGDWENLVSRSRELTDDDLDLLAGLMRFVGDLLIIHPEGVAETWIGRLEEILED